ncbi:Uma2 family endonuclease [Aetokthonos hydrillicola Thurmond2011]|jgi:Uma2 family endonuclease|uniref:Uma2 family endonuclease n=1 Tax=Aetokthonos hydrillicola Thurmond2011 TaxID=2712845 RepID=A0AAP5II19_9CYAN|nr:Uma2 family endonuclease [Aetokthonos hydrillicola]MBO3459929.1 Uma2 family endonuclease [Aetokthonos hydrillicola CCALA 1050]MBW4584046.1 Uma2 family endonuclease [Aetokthonos hydrillicola CCALA 1050]MDR9900688.1 Uma2 family endonuclease [Aetokthonos hydrillicola Thurmond2011]
MTQAQNPVRWTIADLEILATDQWKRYEIIDGELFVTRAPHIKHQAVIGRIHAQLLTWSEQTGLGQPVITPGIIFSDVDNVIPDLIWISNQRLAQILDEEGHLTGAPELVVEVLSSGSINERRDREVKLKLYSIKGVQEYWIVDWRLRQIEVYRRENAQLVLVGTLLETDKITSPLLPKFSCQVQRFF